MKVAEGGAACYPSLSMGGGMGGLLDQAIENGLVPPMVSVMPSAGLLTLHEFQGRFAEVGRLGDKGSASLHAGISHEYRLVKGADHVGASLAPRSLDAFAFVGRQLNPPKWIDDAALRFRAINDENKKERGYPVTPFDSKRIHAQ